MKIKFNDFFNNFILTWSTIMRTKVEFTNTRQKATNIFLPSYSLGRITAFTNMKSAGY